MRKKVCLPVAALCLTMFFGMAGSLGATQYRYQDLTLQGLTLDSSTDSIVAINDKAWIVGAYYDSGGQHDQGFVWQPGVGRTTLQNDSSGTFGALDVKAFGINNQGQIVGQAPFMLTGGPAPCWWSDPSAMAAQLSPIGPSLLSGCAYGINDAGQICGETNFYPGSPGGVPPHAVLWPANRSQPPTDLGTLGGDTSSARSINNAGQVAGTAATAGTPSRDKPCLWVQGQEPQEIPLPSDAFGGWANVINNRGNLLGGAFNGLGGGQAFFWDHQTGLTQYICPDDYSSGAGGMSDHNQVVSWSEDMFPTFSAMVFTWTPAGGKSDLNRLVVNLPQGVTLKTYDSPAISPNGKYITGFDSQGHPYLLTRITALTAVDWLLLLN